jgi:plasmid stabilization system protein ParE
MSDDYGVVATPVFRLTLKKLCVFLGRKYGSKNAASTREAIKLRIAQLAASPYSAPVSERLAALGFTDYRQLLIDQHNLVYYRVDDQNRKVVLVIAMDSCQSIEQLLYETTIMLE